MKLCMKLHVLAEFFASKKYFSLGLLVCSLVACGGGGGPGGLSYTGNTNPAQLTTQNSQVVASSAYYSADMGSGMGTMLAVQDTGTDDHARQPITLSFTKLILNTIDKVDLTRSADAGFNIAALQTVSDTIPGSCGGNTTYSLSYDDVSGSANGTVTFNNYCESELTLSGVISFLGTVDPQSTDMVSVTVTFRNITMLSSAGSYTFDGSALIDYTLTNIDSRTTLNLLIRDNTTRQVHKFENYVITMVIDPITSDSDITIEGNYYDHVYGRVILSTPTPLHTAFGDIYPASGSLVITGANNATITLTALSNTTYQLDLDENGDASIDSTLTGNWVDL